MCAACTFVDPLDGLAGALVAGDAGYDAQIIETPSDDAALPRDAYVAPPVDASMKDAALPDASAQDARSPTDSAIADAQKPVEAGSDAATGPVPYWRFDDDFELGDLRKWTTAAQAWGGASLVINGSGGVHSGSYAMHSTGPTGQPSAACGQETWTLAGQQPVNAGTVAARAWIRMVSIDTNMYLSALTQAQQSPEIGINLGNDGNGFQWGIWMTTPNVNGGGNTSAATVAGADGVWHCLEWVLNVSSSGLVTVYVDALNRSTAVPMVSYHAGYRP